MTMLGNSLIGIGALASLIGINGFIDTRKVDRRFKTGYKNNEPDFRNFGRSCKILLCGIGACLLGLTINHILDSEIARIRSLATQNEAAHDGRAAGETRSAYATPSTNEYPVPEVHAPAPSASNMSGSDRLSSEISGQSNGAQADRAVPAQTFATSFDCSHASQDDESAICHDPGLAAMDRRLAQLYSAALHTVSDPESLRQSESDWITARHQCGKDLDCLRRAYGERIGQFVGSLGSKPLLPTEGN
ncbi:lysozyme inhibitor LprI family protein [Burkholderia stagnalis]|uniref:lysozyme inhibitor LprI family protein n=1 Tax=Burkholderia stagnalis TaxID=1503054 RepID=UPI0009D93119|nr:lysozyme inhibitor LprI family protein [Burkholderia stagnalis]